MTTAEPSPLAKDSRNDGSEVIFMYNIGVYGEAIDQHGKKGGDLNKDIYFYREKDLKIIYRANLDSWEMYDLKEDPEELNNVVDTSPQAEELKCKLRSRVRRWIS